MNVLFLTLSQIENIDSKGIYQDLCRKFRNEGHNVTVVFPLERRQKRKTVFYQKNNCNFLAVKTLNITKTNFIEKGIATLLIEYQFIAAIKKYLKHSKFDLILYSTPPITFYKPIKFIKNRDGSASYLLLKDIFPQNAVDMGIIKKNSLLYRYFRKKERRLYEVSDYIGCMSPENVNYILKHNPEITKEKVEVCPNSIELSPDKIFQGDKNSIKQKYGIPTDVTTFIYGGNLGKAQGLDFLPDVLKANHQKNDRFFIIIGSGTEFPKLEKWFLKNKPKNAILKKKIPKSDYDILVQSCDVGLIFLDPKFTIPNYPSRLLSYLEYKMPVLMAIDKNTDIGSIAQENGYGEWIENGDLKGFNNLLDKMCNSPRLRLQMSENGYNFLKENYTVDQSYKIIMNHFC